MRYFPVIFLAALNFLAGCLLTNSYEQTGAWLSMAPIQCLGNPWEQDWLASHDNDYGAYPHDLSTPGLEEEEQEIIRSFYAEKGVQIEAFSTAEWGGAVCLACSCPQGYTLYVRVPDEDRTMMLDFGFVPASSPK